MNFYKFARQIFSIEALKRSKKSVEIPVKSATDSGNPRCARGRNDEW